MALSFNRGRRWYLKEDIGGYDFERTLTDHFLYFRNHLVHFKRLSKEAAVGGPFAVSQRQFAGNKDDLDGWPPFVDGVRQFQAIHTPGHLNIREQKIDIRARFENGEGFVGVHGFYRGEARVLHDVHRAHAQQHLVFDDENLGWLRDIRQIHGGLGTFLGV
jgi:hypothetical protein